MAYVARAIWINPQWPNAHETGCSALDGRWRRQQSDCLWEALSAQVPPSADRDTVSGGSYFPRARARRLCGSRLWAHRRGHAEAWAKRFLYSRAGVQSDCRTPPLQTTPPAVLAV